jgi:hypothetical protein
MSFLFAQSLSDNLSQYSVRVLAGGLLALFLILALASGLHRKYHFTKKAFYTVVASIVLATTVALLMINLKLITSSEDGAINRMQGKMIIFACGQEVSVVPTSTVFSQSSGDSRHRIFPNGDIEFLGYRTSPETDGSLGSFFRAMGGSITSSVVALPYNDATAKSIVNQTALSRFVKTNPAGEKYLELRSGESCDETPSMVNIFLYEYSPSSHSYRLGRLVQTPESYIISDKQFGEPDCIVISYGQPNTTTDLTCHGYPDAQKIVTDQIDKAGKK